MRVLLVLILMTSLLACTAGGGGAGDDDDDDGSSPSPSPSATPVPTNCLDEDNSKIHVFDDVGDLHTFDPELVGVAEPFIRIGTPNCTPGAALAPFVGTGTPYALALRNGNDLLALYTSGELFRINAIDGTCSTTTFTPQQMSGGTTWSLFSTAFSSETDGSATEHMYIAGGAVDGSLGDLGVVTASSFAVTRIGDLGGSAPNRPELIGLSDATLWGFFPDTASAFVQEIDRSSGALLGTPKPVAIGTGLTAWGAAQWGGDFYVFLTLSDGMNVNSTLRTMNRASGADALLLQNLSVVVTAASSSTCAPID